MKKMMKQIKKRTNELNWVPFLFCAQVVQVKNILLFMYEYKNIRSESLLLEYEILLVIFLIIF